MTATPLIASPHFDLKFEYQLWLSGEFTHTDSNQLGEKFIGDFILNSTVTFGDFLCRVVWCRVLSNHWAEEEVGDSAFILYYVSNNMYTANSSNMRV